MITRPGGLSFYWISCSPFFIINFLFNFMFHRYDVVYQNCDYFFLYFHLRLAFYICCKIVWEWNVNTTTHSKFLLKITVTINFSFNFHANDDSSKNMFDKSLHKFQVHMTVMIVSKTKGVWRLTVKEVIPTLLIKTYISKWVPPTSIIVINHKSLTVYKFVHGIM